MLLPLYARNRCIIVSTGLFQYNFHWNYCISIFVSHILQFFSRHYLFSLPVRSSNVRRETDNQFNRCWRDCIFVGFAGGPSDKNAPNSLLSYISKWEFLSTREMHFYSGEYLKIIKCSDNTTVHLEPFCFVS